MDAIRYDADHLIGVEHQIANPQVTKSRYVLLRVALRFSLGGRVANEVTPDEAGASRDENRHAIAHFFGVTVRPV
jgi:hypothetical protein